MMDDRTGRPTGRNSLLVLVETYGREIYETATANFVRTIAEYLEKAPPAYGPDFEALVAGLFEGIWPGLSSWVHEVFARARATRGQA